MMSSRPKQPKHARNKNVLVIGGPAAPRPYIGHYGRLRKAYLEGYRPRLYTAFVASEKLYSYLAEIDRAAWDMLDYLMPRLAKEAGATEELKAADPMKWVGLINNCKARAEENTRKMPLLRDRGAERSIDENRTYQAGKDH